MKQMGSLTKEERPLAGKAINAAKGELEAALQAARDRIELARPRPRSQRISLLRGRRDVWETTSTHAGDRGYRQKLSQAGFCGGGWAGD